MADNTAGNTIVSLFGEDRERTPRRGPIDLAHEADITLGPLTVRPSLRRIEGPEGEATLEPKVMQVLVALAREPGTILSRDDLIERCWEGRIVGDASINRVLSILRSALRETAGEAVSVETVPRVGYRLLVDGALPGAHAATDMEGQRAKTRRSMPLIAGIALAILAIVGAAAWFARPVAEPGPVRIAMLPLTATGEMDALFVRGFESELRSELARGSEVEVTSSETARLLAADRADMAEIARTLDADLVWKGSIGRSGESLVLDARLVSGVDGSVLWEDRLAGADDASQAMPLRAARAILREIGHAPAGGGRASLSVGTDYDIYLTAQGLIRSRDPAQLSAAVDMLEGVVERNPDFAEGYSALAKATFLDAAEQGRDVARRDRFARELARKALDLDAGSVEATKVIAMLAPDAKSRFEYISRAVEMDAGDSEAWLWFSHITAHPDYEANSPRAMRQLVALDPLWGRAWQAANTVAQHEGVEAGIALERRIESAATEKWQADAARGRIAGMQGDLSESYRLTLGAMPAMTPGQKQIAGQQLSNLMLLMGLELDLPRPPGPPGIIIDVTSGKLPSRAAFASAGLDGENFWNVTPLVIAGPSLFIKERRGDELLALYDAAFASPEDLVKFSERQFYAYRFRTNVATYVGLAMKQAGREAEARALLQMAERSVARWKASGEMAMTPSLFEANLAAVQGDDARALRALERMIEYGYPYILQSPGVALTGPITDDPAWAQLRDDPRLVAMLRPIRANLAKERGEIAALGGG